MKPTTPSTPPVLPYQSPPLRLARKTKLANLYAILSLIAIAPILIPLLIGYTGEPRPVETIFHLILLGLAFGASFHALRFAQRPYRIIAYIPFGFCLYILLVAIVPFFTDFSNRWEEMVFFWRWRVWGYNFWH